jgi:hypothetical protein
MEIQASGSGDLSARRLLMLAKELKAAVPENVMPLFVELMELEHQRGVRDAVKALRRFRQQSLGNLTLLKDLLEGKTPKESLNKLVLCFLPGRCKRSDSVSGLSPAAAARG